jgi:RNA polymerase sigma factor (sigma-70 family)
MSASAPAIPFQRFLDDHRNAVWGYLLATVGRADADDCFQETFLAALRAYPRLREGSDPRAWILTIAHRKGVDLYRRRARQAVPSADPQAVDERVSPAPSQRDEALWEAVSRLPPRQRAAVALRYVADMSHAEIASVIGCSEAASRRSLFQAIQTLREAKAR